MDSVNLRMIILQPGPNMPIVSPRLQAGAVVRDPWCSAVHFVPEVWRSWRGCEAVWFLRQLGFSIFLQILRIVMGYT